MSVTRIVSISFLFLFIISRELLAQGDENHMVLKFINKVEVFAGPSLSFNYGNKFIENFKDENIENRRLLISRYAIGIGLCHKLTNKIDLNFRMLYELKGTKTELVLPKNGTITSSSYTYTYITFQAMARVWLGHNKKWFLALGGYYSKINSLKGYEKILDSKLNTVIKDEKFEGRYFVEVRDDGTISSSTWQPGLTGIERNDYGVLSSIGYVLPISEKSEITIQVIDSYGIANINRNNIFALKEKNHSISFLFAYALHRSSKDKL